MRGVQSMMMRDGLPQVQETVCMPVPAAVAEIGSLLCVNQSQNSPVCMYTRKALFYQPSGLYMYTGRRISDTKSHLCGYLRDLNGLLTGFFWIYCSYGVFLHGLPGLK